LKVVLTNLIGVKTTERENDPPEDENNNDEAADHPSDEVARLGFFSDNTFYLRRGVH